MKRFIKPITKSRQRADIEKDRDVIKDMVFKIRLYSGVAQAIVLNAISTLRKDHKNLVKQELKRRLRATQQQLLRISLREHQITKSDEVDWYFDDRADDLYKLVQQELFIVYNLVHRFFSEHGTDNPTPPALITAAAISQSLVMNCIEMTIDAAPITERFKPIFKEHILNEHETLYRITSKAAEETIKRTRFKTPPKPIFVTDGFNLGEKYFTQLSTVLEKLGLKLIDLDTWHTLAVNEHNNLGEKAAINLTPVPYNTEK